MGQLMMVSVSKEWSDLVFQTLSSYKEITKAKNYGFAFEKSFNLGAFFKFVFSFVRSEVFWRSASLKFLLHFFDSHPLLKSDVNRIRIIRRTKLPLFGAFVLLFILKSLKL